MATRRITPVITTDPYTSGDVIGGELSVAVGLGIRGLLTSIVVLDKDGKGVQLDFFLFNAPLEGTYTNNAAFAIDDLDDDKLMGSLTMNASDYIAAGSKKVGTLKPNNIELSPNADGTQDLVVVSVIRSATTFTAVNDLDYIFGVIK